jgi:uncharacterized protein (DUF2164 family)
MAIELSKEATKEAVASIQRYAKENLEIEMGNMDAGAMLNYFLEEIGPSIYNKGVADAQAKIQSRVGELEYEVFEQEFEYWRRIDRQKKGRK